MKKVFLIAFLVIGIAGFAQEKKGKLASGEKMTQEQKVDLQVRKMTKDLDLNEKQSKEIEMLVAKEIQKREVYKAQIKDDKIQERKEMRLEMEENQAAMTSEMKRILTSEQFAKWEKNREERKEKVKKKMAERRQKKLSEKLPESK